MTVDANILGIRVHAMSSAQLLESMKKCVESGEQRAFAYVNVHAVNTAHRYPRFKAFLNESATTFPDGEGIRMAADLLGCPLPPSTSLTRWIWNLAEFCSSCEYSLFLLGGSEETSNAAVTNLRARFVSIQLHAHHGYFEKTGLENERMIDKINAVSPDIVLVGFGMPMQEEWIEANAHRLRARVLLTGGSCIDYAAGTKPATPEWMIRSRLEWFFRLIHEPRRLFGRYVIGNPVFFLRLLRQKLNGCEPPGARDVNFEGSVE